MTRALHISTRQVVTGALVICAALASALPASAQELPPELTGDYSDLPPPQPAPKPRPTPAPPTPRTTTAPELDDTVIDPEAGDIGPVAPQTPPELSDEEVDEDGGAVEEEPIDDETSALDGAAQTTTRTTRFVLGLGFGAGTLEFERPAQGGVQQLPTTAFAAIDVDLRAQLWPSEALSFEVLLRYQTSIGLQLQLDPLFAVPENIPTRVQRAELSFAPTVRIREGLSIAVPIGAALSLFTPEVHQYPVEAYALISAVARVEAIVTLSDTLLVRVGPEVHALLPYNKALTHAGVSGVGGAIGAQATLEARLGESFSLALSYREVRAVVPSAARFTETDRIITARILGEL